MDWNMPVMDGLQATLAIRKQWPASQKRPYIIAVTAAAEPQIQVACMEAGMNDYLNSPLRLVPLETAVQRAFPLQTEPIAMMGERMGDAHAQKQRYAEKE